MDRLRIYYVPSCAFSSATIAFLAARGAEFEAVNLDLHPKERSRLGARLQDRKLETPTLEVSGALHVAPPLSELKKLLQRWGLPDRAAPHEKLKQQREKNSAPSSRPTRSRA
jgi:glutaredoxin